MEGEESVKKSDEEAAPEKTIPEDTDTDTDPKDTTPQDTTPKDDTPKDDNPKESIDKEEKTPEKTETTTTTTTKATKATPKEATETAPRERKTTNPATITTTNDADAAPRVDLREDDILLEGNQSIQLRSQTHPGNQRFVELVRWHARMLINPTEEANNKNKNLFSKRSVLKTIALDLVQNQIRFVRRLLTVEKQDKDETPPANNIEQSFHCVLEKHPDTIAAIIRTQLDLVLKDKNADKAPAPKPPSFKRNKDSNKNKQQQQQQPQKLNLEANTTAAPPKTATAFAPSPPTTTDPKAATKAAAKTKSPSKTPINPTTAALQAHMARLGQLPPTAQPMPPPRVQQLIGLTEREKDMIALQMRRQQQVMEMEAKARLAAKKLAAQPSQKNKKIVDLSEDAEAPRALPHGGGAKKRPREQEERSIPDRTTANKKVHALPANYFQHSPPPQRPPWGQPPLMGAPPRQPQDSHQYDDADDIEPTTTTTTPTATTTFPMTSESLSDFAQKFAKKLANPVAIHETTRNVIGHIVELEDIPPELLASTQVFVASLPNPGILEGGGLG